MEQKFYKKLENNIPTGNLEIRSNIQSCHPGKNLDDMDVLAELGYCIYYHTPEPSNLNLAKKYVSSDTEYCILLATSFMLNVAIIYLTFS